MGWSIGVGRIAGIPVRLHLTFGLILLLGAAQWGGTHGVQGALFGMLLTLAIFVCITLHELGHAAAARVFGVKTQAIVLYPLGGAAVLERNPARPLHEFLIAAAGPLVNTALTIGLSLVTAAVFAAQGLDPRLTVTPERLQEPSLLTGFIWLIAANIALVAFNLIPAFPLDGGRILRAALAMHMPAPRATLIAASLGQWIAISLAILGILTLNALLLMVAVFIYLGASQERVESQVGSVLAKLRAGDAYNKHAITLTHGDRVGTVVDYMLTSSQSDFAVLHGERLLGIVTRDDVTRAVETNPAEAYVAGIMRREVVRVSASTSLEQVREALAAAHTRVAAVFDGEQFLGLISSDDLAEVYSLHMAMRRTRRRTLNSER
jgi:Zn-dependent protease/CBS domain-containing protein